MPNSVAVTLIAPEICTFVQTEMTETMRILMYDTQLAEYIC